MKTAFLLKNNWIEIFDNLSDKQAGVLIKSLFKYNVNGEKPADLTDIEVKAYFNMMLLDCNAMHESYDKRCETSALNGKSGGAPKGNSNAKKQPNQPKKQPNQPKQPDNENENEKDLNPLTPFSGGKSGFDFSFVEDDFSETFQAWLSYKREKKQRYKTQKSVQACYSHLINLACGNAETARLIVEQSMANNWAGLFELKNPKQTVGSGTTTSSVETFTEKTLNRLKQLKQPKNGNE